MTVLESTWMGQMHSLDLSDACISGQEGFAMLNKSHVSQLLTLILIDWSVFLSGANLQTYHNGSLKINQSCSCASAVQVL